MSRPSDRDYFPFALLSVARLARENLTSGRRSLYLNFPQDLCGCFIAWLDLKVTSNARKPSRWDAEMFNRPEPDKTNAPAIHKTVIQSYNTNCAISFTSNFTTFLTNALRLNNLAPYKFAAQICRFWTVTGRVLLGNSIMNLFIEGIKIWFYEIVATLS